jgi:hypothetical protein
VVVGFTSNPPAKALQILAHPGYGVASCKGAKGDTQQQNSKQ